MILALPRQENGFSARESKPEGIRSEFGGTQVSTRKWVQASLLKMSSHDLMCVQTVEVCADSDCRAGWGVRLHLSTHISDEHCAAVHPRAAVFSGCQSALVDEVRNHSAGPSTELLGPWHEFFRKAMPPSTSGGKRLRSSPPGYLLCTLQWRYTFGCVSPIWIGRRKEGGYTINMVTVLRRGLQYFPTAAQWPRDNKTGQFLLSVSVRAGRQNPGWTGWFWGLGVFCLFSEGGTEVCWLTTIFLNF